MTAFAKMLHSKEGEQATRALDYLDGKQLPWVIKTLDDIQMGRKDWRNRGLRPTYRNITKMIVEKSAQLFATQTPKLEVYVGRDVDQATSALVTEYFDKADWTEAFINIDLALRLLKTVIVLINYDQAEDEFYFDMLHRGNCAVVCDPCSREINMLVYRVSTEDDGDQLVRVITQEMVEDYRIDKLGQEVLLTSVPNPWNNTIPAVVFHDTNIPRTGFWNNTAMDLVHLNEYYNLHLIDSEYAASWAKLQTLFTNAEPKGQNTVLEEVMIPGQGIPRLMPTLSSIIGGPGSVVQLDVANGTTPYVEYKGPTVDLEPIDKMFARWVAEYASDWSVNVKDLDAGRASSGFQLIVEEIDNLRLIKRRSKMFASGFRRLYETLADMFPEKFNIDADLYVHFEEPDLPTDPEANEKVWDLKITGGRASRVDYLMANYELSREEAMFKLQQIVQDEQFYAAELAKTVIVAQPASDVPTHVDDDDVPEPAPTVAPDGDALEIQSISSQDPPVYGTAL
jgi:hypothetical protein